MFDWRIDYGDHYPDDLVVAYIKRRTKGSFKNVLLTEFACSK